MGEMQAQSVAEQAHEGSRAMRVVRRRFSPSAVLGMQRAGVSPVLARVLAARGVCDANELTRGLDELLPYHSLRNCVELARVLADAVTQGSRILVVADYDADGATACSVAVRALRAWGANVGFLIPHRIEHGYGLTPEIVRLAGALPQKPDYLLTVDNGVASHAGVQEAHRLGMEVLVTDHHLAGETLPAARLIVNPNQPECSFVSKALAGVGVIWYVMWAMSDELAQRGLEPMEDGFTIDSLLPIVALGTVADVVALDTNNRILVREGLRQIRAGEGFPGIEALATVSQRDVTKLSTSDIGFGLGPRINAAGRLKTMDAGVECLLADDNALALTLAQSLHDTNQERRSIEGEMVEQAVTALLTDVRPERFTVVLNDSRWHQGVIGIVAGRLKERVWRPTFIFAQTDSGEFKGSGRSIPGFHLRDALDRVDKRCPGVLLRFGGHAMAAGATVAAESMTQFAEAFEAVARELLDPALLQQRLETDGALKTEEMTVQTARELRSQVWGQAFPEPSFSDTFRVLETRRMGEAKQHIRLTLEKDGKRFTAVRFRHEDPAAPPARVRLVFKLDENVYRDESNLQLLVEHIEPA
jgi:single-stranded-DNA-specific exonuclease